MKMEFWIQKKIVSGAIQRQQRSAVTCYPGTPTPDLELLSSQGSVSTN